MKFDKIISPLSGEVTAYSNGRKYYFSSRAAFYLFTNIATKNGTNDVFVITSQYNKTCQIQQAYYDLHSSWDGFSEDSNELIIKYLISDWDVIKHCNPDKIIEKLF